MLKGLFSGWVRNQIEDRNEAVKKNKNMMIAMDPEVAAAFRNSTKVSRKCPTYSMSLTCISYTSHQGRLRQPHAGGLEEKAHQSPD